MSSEFCSRPIDVQKYGYIFAGVQKNCGPAGLAIAIVRKDLIKKENIMKTCPSIIDLKVVDEAGLQMLNTPPCWSVYM